MNMTMIKRIAGGAAVAIMAATVALAAAGCGGGGQITARGSLLVTTQILDSQSPAGAYPDITAGGQVTVVDSAAHVVGTGTLQSAVTPAGQVAGLLGGQADYYTFTAVVPAGLARYGIEVGQNRGTVWLTEKEMRAGPRLCLGDAC